MLEMALVGFEQKKLEIEEKIREIKSLIGGASKPAAKKSVGTAVIAALAPASADDAAPSAPARKKRILSPAAKKRIAAAQKKRWADFHQKKAEAAT
jgi:hypothetical protein